MTPDETSDANAECAMSVEEARLLAHELRAPMTAIVGYSGMLRRSETARERGQIIEGLERAVEVSVTCDGGVIVPGDPLLLRRALDNLLSNAVNYGNGTPIDIEVEADTARAVVSVSDRGPGIPEVDRERVLLPTVRLERDADTPGTGLGLSVVANVADAHGGRIRILGREGGGTTVAIELPATGV